MYENTTYDVILRRMLDNVSNGMDKREGSLIHDTCSSAAIELQNLYLQLEYLIANCYGSTADREHLILLCEDRGITPKAATNTILKGTFTPNDIEVIGQRFNRGEINYIVTEELEPGIYKVRCESAGAVGNQYLGAMTPIDYIYGLHTAVLTDILVPGENEEDTEVLRQRYLNSFKEQAFGGNRADYMEKVKSIDGVGSLKITRVWNEDINPADMIPNEAVINWYHSIVDSLDTDVAEWLSSVFTAANERKLMVGGTVLLTLANAHDFGKLSDVLLEEVQTMIDPVENAGEGYGLAPIGHLVTVKSVEEVPIVVETVIAYENGYSFEEIESQINAVVSDYLLQLRKEWQNIGKIIIRISQIESALLSVKGILDVGETTINGEGSNLTLNSDEVPVFGGVSA